MNAKQSATISMLQTLCGEVELTVGEVTNQSASRPARAGDVQVSGAAHAHTVTVTERGSIRDIPAWKSYPEGGGKTEHAAVLALTVGGATYGKANKLYVPAPVGAPVADDASTEAQAA